MKKTAAKAKKPASKVIAKKSKVIVSKRNVVSISELYAMKKAKEKEKAEAAEAWKHKKELPPHEQGPKETELKPTADMKRTGFGGSRHH